MNGNEAAKKIAEDLLQIKGCIEEVIHKMHSLRGAMLDGDMSWRELNAVKELRSIENRLKETL